MTDFLDRAMLIASDAAAVLGLATQIGSAVSEGRPDREELSRIWHAAEPEQRAAILLISAWWARSNPAPLPEGDDFAAFELLDDARKAESETAFVGVGFPACPLPGPAGKLAMSMGFARDETDDTLSTVLTLYRHHVEGHSSDQGVQSEKPGEAPEASR